MIFLHGRIEVSGHICFVQWVFFLISNLVDIQIEDKSIDTGHQLKLISTRGVYKILLHNFFEEKC